MFEKYITLSSRHMKIQDFVKVSDAEECIAVNVYMFFHLIPFSVPEAHPGYHNGFSCYVSSGVS